MKAPVWFFVLVGKGLTSGEYGTERIPFTQMIITVDGLSNNVLTMSTKGIGREIDLSSFIEAPIPPEYVPPVSDDSPANPTPNIENPPLLLPITRQHAYPVPSNTNGPIPSYPAPTLAQP